MDFLLIYGPPAAGKFTVANELARTTGFKLFHNHTVLDAILPFFDWGTKAFEQLIEKFRLEIISTCAANKVKGLIFTFCYAKPDDDQFIKKIIRVVKKEKGCCNFVLLNCDRNELYRRVQKPSRKKFAKVKSVKNLKKMLKDYGLCEPIPFVENLIIDNTNLSAKKAANLIKKHFKF